MTQARLRTIEEIFYSALELTPGQVGAFLDTACLGDEPLRAEVQTLLAAYQTARGFIETPAVILGAKLLEKTQADLRVGQRIGHFELGERIGTGGMGEVYRATDLLAGRKAALKLLPTRYTGDAERVDRFAQEARAVVALNHPNILTIYEIGEQDSTHYIASELIDGETLRQRLARGPMGAEEALEVAIQVASALHAAHQAGIVHRDIKPENIMLRPDGYVKVLDFGIAKLAQEKVPISPGQEETIFLVETHLGAILGTARYMAPEQVRAAPVGKGADIWSLGIVLYEMSSGRAPFVGETPQEVMHAILTTEPLPLTHDLTNVPGELQPIVERTLRKKSEERYLDAGELIKALKAARRSMELGTEGEKLTSVTSPKPWARPAAALILGAIVIAFALAFYWQRNPPTSPPLEKSVAVMPLLNTNGNPNNQHFSDGFSDELIAVLAKIPGLKVIGRNSSFLFKGKLDDSANIGRQLGVAQLLEGSVQREGNRVRIVASLIRASNGAELWSRTYDRNIKDIFAVQSEIAQAVAAQLKIRLLGEKPASDSARSNPKPAAHDDVLQAVSFLDGSADGSRKAIRYAEEAIALDPGYAAAWATVAELWRGYAASDATESDIDRAYAKARIAAEKAFALDPNSVDALVAMYGLALTPGLDFRSAEKYARRAVELAPGNIDCLAALSSSLVAEGRLQEAEPIRREMTAIDPLHVGWYFHGFILVGLHRYAEARAMFTKHLEMYPKAARVHTQLATLDILENNPKGALEHASLEQEGIWRDFATAMASEAGTDKSAADAALQGFIGKYAKYASFQVAILCAQRQEPDEMFKWLETAYANRDGGLVRVFVIPFLMDYRDDPRFAVFCRKLGIENLPPNQSAIPEKSIAVLPFENLSRDPENAFLSTGIEDEILTRLARIATLKVISRTSTRQYESKPDNLGEIAEQLGVETVLEGSVQKVGAKVRVNVQLINATTGAHLWAESYDRDLIDVLWVESEVATQIASALSAVLTPEEKARLAARPTNNAPAYELYLRATQLHSGENNSRSAFAEAQKMFEQTVALDPGFAAAHAGFASMSALLYTAFEPRKDYKAKALSEAQLAIQLDPNSVPGHSALAYCLNRIEGSYEAAAREYEIARQLAPNDSNLIRQQGLMRRQQGHWREGVASLQQAAALDPQNISTLGWLAGTYEDLHQWKASDPLRERIVTLSQKMSPETLAEARFIRGFAWFDGTGDSSLLNKAMAETPAEVDQDGLITLFRYQACMFGHRFDEAERIIAASPRLVFENPWGTPAPKSFLQGCAVMAKGEKARARSLFEASLLFFQKEVGDHPEVANRHAALGILLAYLDNKPEALAEAQRASELLPESKDAYYGLDISNMCAIIFARLSDADRALPLIERLLRTPRGVPLQELRFSPDWDPLRNDPRFQKILSSPEPKVIYN